ncbi:MAG: hypothetical protein V7L29_21860 [Nostoc sp.]
MHSSRCWLDHIGHQALGIGDWVLPIGRSLILVKQLYLSGIETL